MARRVAVAVAEQVPSAAGDPGRFVVAGVPLTAGLASAFVDQTLAAVTVPGHRSWLQWWSRNTEKALGAMSSLRTPRNKRRTVREAWMEALVDFVDGVNRRAGGEVWAVLRDWLPVGSADDGGPGAEAVPGAEEVPGVPGAEAVPGAPGAEAVPGAPGAEAVPGAPGAEAVPGAPGAPGAEADVAVSARGVRWSASGREMEARRILGGYRLDRVGRHAAGMNIARWVGSGRPSGQGWRGRELEGVFPSWVALSALPTSSGKADPGPLAVARQRLGRIVVGALWRSVEAAQGAAQGGAAVVGGRAASWGTLQGWRGGWRLRWPSRFLRSPVSRGGS